MKTLLNNIANLFKVKTIITVGIIATLCWGFVRGIITTEVFAAIAGSVTTYYFARREDGKGGTDDESN